MKLLPRKSSYTYAFVLVVLLFGAAATKTNAFSFFADVNAAAARFFGSGRPDDKKPANARKAANPDERIDLVHADNMYFDEYQLNGAQRLSGKVELHHKGMKMFCDSAMLYEASQTFDAFGNVRIIQGDTLSLKGDMLHYDGETLMAEMRKNVVMRHREQVMYTDSLNYDRLYSVGYYFDGGRLIDGDNKLTSDWGEYHTDTRNATFNYNVELINPKFRLVTDTLHYDTQTKWSEVVGPSNIYSNADRIYTERGFYNSTTAQARLFERNKAYGRDREMQGDTVYYDKNTGVMEAFGNVECIDLKNKNILTGHYAFYNELTGEAMATKRALARDFSQGADTLYVHADTLRMFTHYQNTDSVYRKLHGYFHVRAYRNDVQAVSDSLVFTTRGNCLTLYRDPILWSGERQILGEEIRVYMADSSLDSIHVDRQALMAEQLDSVHFNQVASQEMRTYFKNGDISENRAIGNVLVVNYPLEKDSLILYHNYTETALARMFMQERRMKRIWTPQAHGFFYPVGLAPKEHTLLPGFAWFDYIRPLHKDDIYEWRPKRKGTELKPSIRRKAPLPKL